jgi:hypothetical protein
VILNPKKIVGFRCHVNLIASRRRAIWLAERVS